jgi:hypothetical protein
VGTDSKGEGNGMKREAAANGGRYKLRKVQSVAAVEHGSTAADEQMAMWQRRV